MSPEFENYTISRVLGEGGMGLVYLAHDRRTGLPVAIKMMSRREFDPELRARFLKENRILSALNHRNIVRCYEITESRDGVLSIVMEYIDGVDFRAFEGRPYPELLPLMIQALMGLSYLRSQNVVHRDLSSNNIFVTLENQTRVTKILDFGVAKILEQQAADGDVRTRTGQFLGKFAFASPEHFFPASIDWRSDVYSLGVIFHRLLTKKPPIIVARKANYYDWLVAHQKENVFEVLAPAGVPALPQGLRDIVRRMLSRSPDDRPQSYEEILDVLDGDRRAVPAALEPDPLALRALPSPVEGRIGSSNPSSPPSPSPSVARSAPAADAEPPVSVEASQQKRWPDLAPPEPATERFVPLPSRHAPAVPPGSPSPEDTLRPEAPAASFATREERRAPASADVTKTAPTVVPDDSSGISMWSGGAAKGAPGGLDSSSPRLPEEREEKTERLDDVIAKLRQQSSREPLPPLKQALTPESFAPTPPAQPFRRPEPEPPAPRASEPSPGAPPGPGRRLVVYGESPPPARAASRAPRTAGPPVPAAPPVAAGRRIRSIGIGLIVAAIVILFAAVLWILVSLVRGSTGETRRTGRAGAAEVVAEAAHRSALPKPE
jgi:serine/threonine-protein kinase